MTRFRIGLLAATAAATLSVSALPAAAKTHATTVVVTAAKPSEFRFTLSRKSVPHGVVIFKVTNKSATLPHDFKIDGKKTKQLSPGQSQTLTVTFKKAGKYPYVCTLPGHAAAGMKGVLTVT
jgi:uncharacterized cupredoxin-like copper-binding protein